MARVLHAGLVLGVVAPSTLAALAGDLFAGILIHGSQEVSERYITVTPEGPVFHAPGGVDWLLLSRPWAPASGDAAASFHPMAEADVEAAIRGIQFPLETFQFEVFILPFPPSKLAGSSASNRCLFLAPGIRDYTPEEVHFVVSHEMGHLVQAELMPDSDRPMWTRYRALRGIADTAVFGARAEHARRPHEIFAEDFRYLFGDEAARYTGGIENSSLALPTANPQVRTFFLALYSGRPAAGIATLQLAAGPNPTRGRIRLTYSIESTSDGSSAGGLRRVRLEVFAPDGRRVAQTVDADQRDGTYSVELDARGAQGRGLPVGTWFARLSAGGMALTRKLTVVP